MDQIAISELEGAIIPPQLHPLPYPATSIFTLPSRPNLTLRRRFVLLKAAFLQK